MRQLLKHVMSFEDVNWWTLVSGFGANFIIAAVATILGAYLGSTESTTAWYALYGPPLMLLGVFVAALLTGMVVCRSADDVPLRHAFLSSLGAVAPFVFGALFTLNYMLLMLAIVAVLGNMNGAMMALPKPHRRG
jgi:hypothetical protein